MKSILKRDKYKSARGGNSKLLDICCRNCGNCVLSYQKDGPGRLFRLYVDRIIEPENIEKLKNLPLKNIPLLKCPKCGEMLGTPCIYAKEQRPAFRLHQYAIIKKTREL